ncbi:MAG TPA: glycosyltransferase family 4 protein [Opitutaceae bacterium]|jgi:glycosyltransferase involved in cell wall biosynthesis
MNPVEPAGGPLDGRTILRFAHAYTSGGGVERLLDDLDGILLARSAATVVRLYIGQPGVDVPREISVGRGRLCLVPLFLRDGGARSLASDHEAAPGLKQRLRNAILYQPMIWRTMGRRYTLRRKLPPRSGEVKGAGECLVQLAQQRHLDLCVLHFFGGADAEEVLLQAHRYGIPVALQNHFANDRFDNLSIRKHALLADGVAGVSGIDVPAYVSSRFVNLSDGIDLACFDRGQASPVDAPADTAVILMPARIVRPKGQMDLVNAAAELQRRGLNFQIAFAGRVDSAPFEKELRDRAAELGVTDRVRFLGQLPAANLRDWLAASAAVAFPTYHHEGLSRILIESQAMGVPVVAYNTGGNREAFVDGQTGFLVRTGDVDRLADCLAKLLVDPALRKRMAEAGPGFARQRYGLEAVAQRHEEFYLKLIARGPVARAR